MLVLRLDLRGLQVKAWSCCCPASQALEKRLLQRHVRHLELLRSLKLLTRQVAEHLRVPLYTMSAGELGENASDVEETLERILDLSTKWNAILLLDECDIFLEQRRDNDLVRNKIVSGM